jgi:hypothetical protein
MSVPTPIPSDTPTHTDTPKDKPTPIFRMKNILKFSTSNLQNIDSLAPETSMALVIWV